MFLTRLLRPISRLCLTPMPGASGRDGVAIVLIVRDEARHIGEWAQFHHRAGIRHVFAYDNGSSDGSMDALRAALPGDAVTIIPWAQKHLRTGLKREIHNQVLAYAHALTNFGADYRWMAFIDVDEFIVPVAAASIPAALAGLEAAAHLSLPWHNFGRNGHETPPEGGVLANYLRTPPSPYGLTHGLNFKCLVDPSRVTAVGVHAFEIDGRAEGVNDRGDLFRHADRTRPGFYSRERLQLNHYYTRSNTELQAKIRRGSNRDVAANRHVRRVLRIVAAIEADTVEDQSVARFLQRLQGPPA